MSSSARRVGALAIVLATTVGVLLPMNPTSPFATGAGDGPPTPSRADPALILDPLASMRRSILQATDTQVLEYSTQAKEPSYLRVSVLESFDGSTWLPRPGLATGRDGGVPLPGRILATARGDSSADDRSADDVSALDVSAYDITVTNLANAYLPLPYPAAQVSDLAGLGADWRLDPGTGMAFSADSPASGRSYRVDVLEPRIRSDELRGATAPRGELWPLLNLPGGMSPRISQLAEEVTSGARTPYDRAVALQRWFTRDGGFTYSTSVPSGAGADYIAEFLDERIGYCEQFAGAMAVMARSLGIPSRVVVGFTQGSRGADGTWRVTARDAHAWPELWFDGVGWARFEPTPRAGATVLTPDYARTPDEASATDADSARRRAFEDDLDVAAPPQQRFSFPWAWVLAGTTLVGLALLCAPMTARIVRRRRRLRARGHAAAVEGAWAEIGDLAHDLGQSWATAHTPRQAAERLSRGMPEHAASALQRVRREVEQVRYARPVSGAGSGAQSQAITTSVATAMSTERTEAVRADVRAVARELRSRVRWQARVAAYCWPSSERRRQRSSMRSMKPGEEGDVGADGLAGVSAWASRVPKAE